MVHGVYARSKKIIWCYRVTRWQRDQVEYEATKAKLASGKQRRADVETGTKRVMQERAKSGSVEKHNPRWLPARVVVVGSEIVVPLLRFASETSSW